MADSRQDSLRFVLKTLAKRMVEAEEDDRPRADRLTRRDQLAKVEAVSRGLELFAEAEDAEQRQERLQKVQAALDELKPLADEQARQQGGRKQIERVESLVKRLEGPGTCPTKQHFDAVRRLREDLVDPPRPGVVFVLGAGCSIQYGLPSFLDLLSFAYEDLNPDDRERGLTERLESLRDRLDSHWRASKPAELRKLLARYLRRIDGKWCTAYLHLARMASQGYIRAIVNMNFDTLLEEAFDERPEVQRTFALDGGSRDPVVIKPHGSLRERDGIPILDLARSDLFDNQAETEAANSLFRGNDVVFIGYSGSDAKIAAALSPEEVPTDGWEVAADNYNQIFVFNIARPDPRLLKIIVDRQSTDLMVIGREAAFENVMTELSSALEAQHATHDEVWKNIHPARVCHPTPRQTDEDQQGEQSGGEFYAHSEHFTAAEAKGLERCRKLAINLRSRLNVAEGGQISIEQHAAELFKLCLRLAYSTGNGLTTPEKYLLHCAAYLHDLGYFWAHSSGRKHHKYGWQLLTTHGEDTETLLRKLPPEELDAIVPGCYRNEGREQPEAFKRAFREGLILLCRLHSLCPHRSADLEKHEFEVPIADYRIPVRLDLLGALFSAAEELSQGHPFFPSPYSLEGSMVPSEDDGPRERAGERDLEDPVLDLYLRQKHEEITFRFRREAVVGCLKSKEDREDAPTDSALFLAVMANDAVEDLNDIAEARGGRGIHFRCEHELPVSEEEESDEALMLRLGRLLQAALAEQFQCRLEELRQAADRHPAFTVGLVASIVDLVALYTDPIYVETSTGKPLCTLEGHERVRRALESVQRPRYKRVQRPRYKRRHPRLLHRFMLICNEMPETEEEQSNDFQIMKDHFRRSFDRIYRPAWRFCADKWLNGVDALVMARASLDFGSSRFRNEVVNGLQDLLDDKLTCKPPTELRRPSAALREGWYWHGDPKRWHTDEKEKWGFGHDGCTICTSRLLYVFSVARRLLPSDTLRKRFHDRDENSLEAAVCFLLQYMIRKSPDDPSWWGIEEQQRLAEQENQAEKALHSADYVAWAVRATVQALIVDAEVREATGKGWLDDECSVPLDSVHRLFEKLWTLLCSIENGERLLSDRAEEPHSYIVGHVAISCLDVLELWDEISPKKGHPAWKDLWTLLDKHAGNFSKEPAQRLKTSIKEALTLLKSRHIAQLSEFFAWPAYVFLASAAVIGGDDATMSERKADEDDWAQKLVALLEDCLKSRVWIETGEGRGSWGYNIENTQRIVSSMAICWRYCFKHHKTMARLVTERLGRLGSSTETSRGSATRKKSRVRPSPRGTKGRRRRS